MFARVKRNDRGGEYLLVVENVREVADEDIARDGARAEPRHRQRTVVNLGSVAHVSPNRQEVMVAGLAEILADVRPLKARRKRVNAERPGDA